MDEQRILDENDVEITIEDVDFELGHLEPNQIFKEHHDAIEEQQREYHYRVSHFYFEDETDLEITDEDDPHVVKTDIYKGIFSYQALEGEEPKHVRGIDLLEIEDKPYAKAKEAWDEYEQIQRYILYTEEELENRRQQKEQEQKQQELLNTGLDRIVQLEEDLPATEEAINQDIETINVNYALLDESLTETNTTVEDLVLIMADILGGEEEYPEEEDTEPMQ